MWRPEFTLNRQEALSGAVRTEASQRKMQIAVRRGSAIVWGGAAVFPHFRAVLYHCLSLAVYA